MPIPQGLHFDPIELASKVDPSIVKKYDMPYKGQTFIQLHQGGTHVVVGTCVGLDLHMDRTGNVTAWRASIESKFTTASGISNGNSWRDASEWHPAPLTQQESVTDVRDALNALAEKVRLVVESASSADAALVEALSEIEARVEKLEAAAPAPAARVSPDAAVAAIPVPGARFNMTSSDSPTASLPTPLPAPLPDIVPQPASPAARASRFKPAPAP